MNRRFYWPWQLVAHPDIVLSALLDLRLSEIQLGSVLVDSTVFNLVFFAILKLIGYDQHLSGEANIYQHVWDQSMEVSVALNNIIRRGTISSFTCCSGSGGNFSTTFIVDLDTAESIVWTKELIISWVELIVHRVMLHLPLPRPRRGCLIICGEDFGSESTRAFFRYDLFILQSQVRTPLVSAQNLYITSSLSGLSESTNAQGLRSFTLTSGTDRPEVVEYVVIENESKDVIMQIMVLFFAMGYVSPMCIFNGHGMSGSGELVVHAQQTTSKSKTAAHDTISYREVSQCVNGLYENYTIASGGLAEELFVLNSSHSHLFQGCHAEKNENATIFTGISAPAHSSRLQMLPLTSEALPTAPAHGLIKHFRRYPEALPAQYHVLLAGLIESEAPLPGIKLFINQFSRSECSFKSSPPHADNVAHVKSGVYVFLCGEDSAGLVRVVYDQHSRHALVVDGGTDSKLFHEKVWRGFLLLYVTTYDVLLATADGRCASGIYALFNSKTFHSRQRVVTGGTARCRRLYTKYASQGDITTAQQAHCSDMGIILSQALKLGVDVMSGVSKGDLLYKRRHRSLHAQYGIRVEVLAPSARSPAIPTQQSVSVPSSPLRKDVGLRIKEQLEISLSAGMSDLDISLISSLVSLYSTSVTSPAPRSTASPTKRGVHSAAVRDRTPVELSVRAWTKIARVKEPGVLQCTIKRIAKKGQYVSSRSAESTVKSFPWIEYLQFPPDNV